MSRKLHWAVLEKDISFGNEGAVYTNVNSALQKAGVNISSSNYIGGLGGKNISPAEIENIFAENTSAEIVGLLVMLVEKEHSREMGAVLEYFIERVKEHKHIGTAYVTTAMELSGAKKAAVEKRLLETTKYVKFEMNYAVDSALIGGMVIRIGDRVVDNSVRTKLYDLTRELSKG